MTLLVSMGAFAQGNGIGGITEATNMVTSYRGREGIFQVLVG